MKRKLGHLLVLAALFCFTESVQAISWTSLDFPSARQTYITGIDGGTIVGYYSNYEYSSYGHVVDPHGFVYDGQTWTTFDCPGLVSHTLIYHTMIEGIENGNIVGSCLARSSEKGFIYDGQTWTLLNFPGARNTYIQGIDRSNIAGYYTDESGYHGFVYDGTTWDTLLYPWTGYTSIADISGDNVAIYDYINRDGVIYNLNSQIWSSIEFPGAENTIICAIDGSNIVGAYGEGESCQNYFLYNGSSWTTLDFSSIQKPDIYLSITDMDGDNIVGFCFDASGVHGFIATIPEPATIIFLTFGGLMLRKKR